MSRPLLSLIAIAALAGCAGVSPVDDAAQSQGPSSIAGAARPTSARLVDYPVAIVRDLVVDPGGVKELNPAERAQLAAAMPEVVRQFGQGFRQSLESGRYFREFADSARPGALVLEPVATSVLPGYQAGEMTDLRPTRIEFSVQVSDAATGKALGTYSVSYSGFVREKLPLGRVETVRRLMPLAAERVAQGIRSLQ